MLQAMPGAADLPEALQAQILATTDGVPLFVEEITKYVLAAPRQHRAAPNNCLTRGYPRVITRHSPGAP
jgi:hypothetical protein